ncbi:hypothetical protein Goshw_017020 [Gossypium schwendimanii]|uniref:RNase H type-1 domain-containing protein n=1 Tax=Gossypium schwendimanii TaxID=34291 RepID=A0A7J9NC04_GOSSC|nr:hypothetical protein [Gossypium schwendimanii]
MGRLMECERECLEITMEISGTTKDAACGTCSHNYESVLHVLWDCPMAKDIWMQLIPPGSSFGTCRRIETFAYFKVFRGVLMRLSKPLYVGQSNGSVKYVDMFAAAESLLHDHNGTWIVGFTMYLGNCEVIHLELWCILDRLQIAFDRGFQNIIIRTDNLEAVNLIHEGVREGSNSALVTRILLLLKLLSH